MKTKLLFLFFGLVALSVTAQHDTYWETQNSNFPVESRGINYISVVDDNVAWAKAYNGADVNDHSVQEFTKTVDGGATWVPGNINVGDAASGIAMVHAVSADIAWAVAYPNSGSAQGIFKTTDGGATWNEQTTALFDDGASFANVVYFWDENVGFCQGDPVDGYFELYTTDDGGDNWTRVPQADIPDPLANEFGYVGQIFVAGDALWFTTSVGRIYRSYDHGHTFEAFQSPVPDFGGVVTSGSSGEVAFKDNDNGYLINQDGTFWKTSDGGESWGDPVFPDSGLIFGGDICAVPGTNAVFTTGAGDLKGAAYSFDGGLNWVVTCDDQHLDIQFTADGATGYSGGFNGGENGDDPTIGGIFKYIGPGVGLPDLQAKGFVAYPNPVLDELHLGANESISQVSIYNLLGQKVLTQNINAATATVNTAKLAKGTYIVNVIIGDTEGSFKIVK